MIVYGSPCFLKLFLVLVIVLILIQYMYSTFETHSAPETLFPVNLTSAHYGPLFSLKSQELYDNESRNHSQMTPVSGSEGSPDALEHCPLISPHLIGLFSVKREGIGNTLEDVEDAVGAGVMPGGQWRPAKCRARDRVALIVPYRDRPQHLNIFLANIHPFLQRQLLDYGIFVIEQAGSSDFNRAMLLNIGFVEALGLREFDCFVFHDVDLVPEDDRNLYTCPDQPRHMSAAIDVFNYRLPYADIFGGVSAMTREHFEKVNGFSNMFWGWGGEDDDMAGRIKAAGLHIVRYPASIARYTMLPHTKQKANPNRFENLYEGKKRMKTDGLNSLQYRRIGCRLSRLFTWVLVELSRPSK